MSASILHCHHHLQRGLQVPHTSRVWHPFDRPSLRPSYPTMPHGMVSTRLLLLSLFLVLFPPPSTPLPTEDCPNSGPAFTSYFDLCNTTTFRNATTLFPSALEALLNASAISNTSTFTLSLFSTYTNTSLYNYTHIAPTPNATITQGGIGDETVFRVGSVSKLFTAYALLVAAREKWLGEAVWERSVTDFLPELAGNEEGTGLVVWEEVSVGALMAQEGGTGGMPLEVSSCYAAPTPGCPIKSTTDFLTFIRDHQRAVVHPWSQPLYSDAGFGVLGRVLERISGRTYEEALQELLVKPLGLKSTTSIEPQGKVDGVEIPWIPAQGGWGFDSQVAASSGGIYTSHHDLRIVGLSILHSTLLSPTTTRHWLKPLGNTGTLTTQVGAPWEIYRLALPITPSSNKTRISDLYIKAGGNPDYGAIFALSPDHGLGFSILVAGPLYSSDRLVLRDLFGEVFLEAAEWAAVDNAARNWAGEFVAGNETQGSNLTLTVDEDHPGLGMKSFFLKGRDALSELSSPTGGIPAAGLSVRLWPMGMESTAPASTGKTTTATFSSYRAFSKKTGSALHAEVEGGPKGQLFDQCGNWAEVDFYSLGGVAPDEFVFEDVGGRVVAIVHPATGSVFGRVEG